MKKIPTPYLRDILESISRIEKYIAEIDQDNVDALEALSFEQQDKKKIKWLSHSQVFGK